MSLFESQEMPTTAQTNVKLYITRYLQADLHDMKCVN